jgi:phosphorylcholine metabolism protein LicD
MHCWRWREEQKNVFRRTHFPLTIDVDFDGQFSTKLEGFELALL